MGKLLGIARKSKSRAPMEEIAGAELTAETGLEGDYRGKLRRRQVSVLSREAWEETCREHGEELPWTTRRANLLVEGIELLKTTGARLTIGSAILEVYCETDPCSRMDDASPGLRKALETNWRGGVCCRVISGGEISVGDNVTLDPA